MALLYTLLVLVWAAALVYQLSAPQVPEALAPALAYAAALLPWVAVLAFLL